MAKKKVIELTEERFDNIVEMLKSPDEENHTLALTIINGVHIKNNLVYVLLARKLGHASEALWKEHAPKIHRAYTQMEGDYFNTNKNITFKAILRALTEMEAGVDQVQIFLNYFCKHLLYQIQNLGYDFVEDMNIIIKLKEEYHEQSRKSCKNV